MLVSNVRRGAALIGSFAVLALGAAPAVAATTFAPNRFDDPISGGTSCGPPAVAGKCSLRGAIAAAGAGDTIQLGTGTYELSLGELKLTKMITILGAGPGATTIRQTGIGKVLHVENGLTMSGVTVTGGHDVGSNGANGVSAGQDGSDGGGAYGAGIDAGGAVTLTDVIVTGNTATGGNGGNGAAGTSGNGGKGGRAGWASGAGINGGNPLVLTRVAITNNVAQPGKAGAGGDAGTNGVGGKGGAGGESGGAGVSLGFAPLIATDVLIAGNSANTTPGGKGGRGGTSTGVGGAGGQGETADGGGLFSNGTVKLTNVTISGNVAGGGIGGAGGAALSGSSTVGGAGGAAFGGSGGGVALFNGAAGQFASTTIAANTTTPAAAGAGGAGSGGGAAGKNGEVIAQGGGDAFIYNATLAIRDTIIAAGQGPTGAENCWLGGGGKLTSNGHNLEDRKQCIALPATGDLANTPAGLGPLQDNGGPTQTMALLSGSAAIDTGEANCVDASGAPLATDQRGLPRGNPCDIGAFEVQPPPPPPPPPATTPELTKLKLSPAKLHNGQKAKLSFRLNVAATVNFKLKRKTGKRLVALKKGAPKSFAARTGKNKRTWKPSGLLPGRYRLLAKPVGGKPVKISFTVLKPEKGK